MPTLSPSQMLNFEMIFNASPDAYLVLDPDLIIVAVTDIYLQAVGMTRAAIVGQSVLTTYPYSVGGVASDSTRSLQASLQRVKQALVTDTLAVLRLDVPTTSADIENRAQVYRYWSTVNAPVLDAEGKLAAIIHRVQDVTEFIDAKSEGGQRRGADNGEAFATDLLRSMNDAEIEIFTRTQALQQGNQVLRTANLDLTTRESEMRLLNLELEKRVADRTADLVKINQELEAFNYSVSHDLRTPLRALDGFSQAILEDYGDILDDAGKRYLDRIRKASQRMSNLIDDLLRLSRVSRREIQLSRVDMSALAREIAVDLQSSHQSRQVKFIIQPGIQVDGDKNLLQIVLQNLLDNAWKFSSKVPYAVIEFGLYQANPVPIYFVRDNGVGFDMAYINKLFIAFQRLHTTDEFEGTGIGLVTVQRIIHRHGGKIWVESAVNQGSTFYFTLSS